MMKKLLALLLVSTMVLGVPTAAFAGEEAGFDEYELGTEGEQDVDFMTMSMVYFQIPTASRLTAGFPTSASTTQSIRQARKKRSFPDP